MSTRKSFGISPTGLSSNRDYSPPIALRPTTAETTSARKKNSPGLAGLSIQQHAYERSADRPDRSPYRICGSHRDRLHRYGQ